MKHNEKHIAELKALADEQGYLLLVGIGFDCVPRDPTREWGSIWIKDADCHVRDFDTLDQVEEWLKARA